MAKKKRKKRPYTPPAPKAATATATATDAPARPAPPARRQNKEEARRARERALRQLRRRQALRRVSTIVVVAVVVGGVFFLLTRVGTPELSEEAVAAAEAAGCSPMERQTDHGGGHDAPYEYPDRPATSGRHDPSPLPAGVYTEPQPEERLVHSLEHGYAVLYYRAEDPEAAPEDVRTALEGLADDDEEKVIVAPYPALPEGTSVAFAAWNYLMTCPGTIEPGQVRTIGESWIDTFRESATAPEPNGP